MSTFTLDLSRFKNKSMEAVKLRIKRITFEAFYRIIMRTAVDTGRARANWMPSIGAMSTTYELETFDKSGRKATARARRTVEGWDCTGSIFITNNLSYILGLEYSDPGSNQSPAGMVRITVAEMQAWAQNASNIKGRV